MSGTKNEAFEVIHYSLADDRVICDSVAPTANGDSVTGV
jgi:hypothetical protein